MIEVQELLNEAHDLLHHARRLLDLDQGATDPDVRNVSIAWTNRTVLVQAHDLWATPGEEGASDDG